MIHWPWLIVLLTVVAEAALLAMLLMPLVMAAARRWNFLAWPGGRHIHAQPTPTLGGQAIVWSFLIVVAGDLLIVLAARQWIGAALPDIGQYITNIPSISPRLVAVLGGALAISFLGLIDDHKPLPPVLKLIAMILSTLPLAVAGIRIEGFLPWPWMGGLLTVAWVVFLTNSFNFLDNMDGLTGGVAAIASLAFALIAFFSGQWFMAIIFGALAGSLIGFLRYNFYPARVFMGDNGSLFIGYLIAALSIMTTYYEEGVQTALPVLTPLIVLGVPIFDTISVMWIRWRNGRPLMVGDTNHFSHRLVALGMSRRRAVVFIYIVTGAVGLGAVALRSVNPVGAWAILAQTALVFWIIYFLERTSNLQGKR